MASSGKQCPGCQRFLAARFVTCRPTNEFFARVTIGTLTETGNRARQTSGTQGRRAVACGEERKDEPKSACGGGYCYTGCLITCEVTSS